MSIHYNPRVAIPKSSFSSNNVMRAYEGNFWRKRKEDKKMNLLIESRRSKRVFIKSLSGRLRVPELARGSHKTPALFTMLIGAHVKHKFMLKAEMLSSSQMRSGADRSCLPVPDDQPLASRCFETQDNVGIYLRYVYNRSIFFLPPAFFSPRINRLFSSLNYFYFYFCFFIIVCAYYVCSKSLPIRREKQKRFFLKAKMNLEKIEICKRKGSNVRTEKRNNDLVFLPTLSESHVVFGTFFSL